jgi:hypothetical protein
MWFSCGGSPTARLQVKQTVFARSGIVLRSTGRLGCLEARNEPELKIAFVPVDPRSTL